MTVKQEEYQLWPREVSEKMFKQILTPNSIFDIQFVLICSVQIFSSTPIVFVIITTIISGAEFLTIDIISLSIFSTICLKKILKNLFSFSSYVKLF